MTSRPVLLSPQEPPREIVAYRRVWRTALTEAALLLAVAGGVLLVVRVLHPAFGANQKLAFDAALAGLPALLWFAISYRQEGRVRYPRERLLTVFVLSALVANGVGLPLLDRVFAVDSWLPTTSGLTRIMGYTLTAGFTHEFLKFAVLRFTIWPGAIGRRVDGVAYSLAAASGYALVLNLNGVLNEAADPAAVALRVAGVALSQMGIGTIMGYWLAELKLSRPSPVWLPLGLSGAALLHGLFITVRGGVIVGGIGATATGSSPIAGLGLAAFIVLALFAGVSFLIRNADERAKRSPEFSR